MQEAAPSTGIRARIGVVPTYRNRYTDWCRGLQADCLAALRAVDGVELVEVPRTEEGTQGDRPGATPYGCVNTMDQAETAAEHLRREGVDGIVILPLDFGDERAAAKVAERLAVPVLLFATKEPPLAPDGARVSDSYCGTLTISVALHRRTIPFRFGGVVFPGEDTFRSEVATFARAAAVVSGLRHARLGQVGLRPTTFESVCFDEAQLISKFGQHVITCDLGDILTDMEELADDDPTVDAVARDIGATTATRPGPDQLRRLAEAEVVLTRFWQKHKLSAMAARCWPTFQRLMGCGCCALYGRLTNQGMLTACESDIVGADSMLVSYRAALCRTIPHFVDWTIQHRTRDNCFLAWHCGNAPPCLARDKGGVGLTAAGVFEFEVEPGAVTLCRLAEYGGQWKLLITSGEIVPASDDEREAGTFSWVEVPDHARLYRTLIEEGFIHHASMAHGDQVRVLEEACRFLDIHPVVVG